MQPQTISFEVEFTYPSWEVVNRKFLCFDSMFKEIHKQKRRRAKKDRPENIRYKNVLTDLGRERYKAQYGTTSPAELSEHLGITIDEWMKW